MGERLRRLVPVGLVFAALLGLSVLGLALEVASPHAHALWLIFFLMPFTLVYCIPFGLGVGILAQRRVWYTPSYGHRLVAAGTAIVAVAMLLCWSGGLAKGFDIMYCAAILWPTVASGVAMLIGMYYVREEEYEEAARLADEYGDGYEGEYADDYDAEYGDEGVDEYDDEYADGDGDVPLP